MKFDLQTTYEEKTSISAPYSVVLTQDMTEEIKTIKRKSDRNKKLVNHLAKQFFAQLIEKFHNGEFDDADPV